MPGMRRANPIVTKLFDDAWLARTDHGNGRASQVTESLDTTGGIYLSKLRSWFNQFPLRKNERRVIEGRVVLSRNRSAIYLNPLARHPLRSGLFPSLTEFSSQVAIVQAQSSDLWLSL